MFERTIKMQKFNFDLLMERGIFDMPKFAYVLQPPNLQSDVDRTLPPDILYFAV